MGDGGARASARAVALVIDPSGGARAQRRFETPERVRDDVFVERAARLIGVRRVRSRVVARQRKLRLSVNAGTQLLELRDPDREILPALALELRHGEREGAVQLERRMCEAPVVEILSRTESQLLADERRSPRAEQCSEALLRAQRP